MRLQELVSHQLAFGQQREVKVRVDAIIPGIVYSILSIPRSTPIHTTNSKRPRLICTSTFSSQVIVGMFPGLPYLLILCCLTAMNYFNFDVFDVFSPFSPYSGIARGALSGKLYVVCFSVSGVESNVYDICAALI